MIYYSLSEVEENPLLPKKSMSNAFSNEYTQTGFSILLSTFAFSERNNVVFFKNSSTFASTMKQNNKCFTNNAVLLVSSAFLKKFEFLN